MNLTKSSISEIGDLIEKVDKEKEIIHPEGSSLGTVKSLMHKFSSSEDFHIFTYHSEGHRVGFTSTFPDNEEGRIAIGVTYILPQFRGRGYGYHMRNDLVNWIKEQRFTSIYARTWSGNKAMLSLNEKMGFKEIGRDVGVRENGDDTVKFLLALD